MTAESVINLAPSTKEQITAFANQIINNVSSGEVNPLKIHSQIILLEKSLELIKKGIKEDVLAEAGKHGKSFDFNGCTINVKELGVKYDYSNCGDLRWKEANRKRELAEEEMKKREALLRCVDVKESFVDEETGECYTVWEPRKTSSTGLTVTAK